MKVVVDFSICDLHGLCVEAAPEVFQIGDDDALHILNETPPDGLRAKVDKAVRECPTGAISISLPGSWRGNPKAQRPSGPTPPER